MGQNRVGAAAVCLAALLAYPVPAMSAANGREPAVRTDVDRFEWAFGRIVDTVVVETNGKTHNYVLLREMETRADHPLERRKLARDIRYLNDLSVVANATVEVTPAGDRRCAVLVRVRERATILLKLIYPILEYDFNSRRFRYGLKWDDRNFRGRLENFSADVTRNSNDDDNASIGWSSSWLGLRHVGLGARVSYFNRGHASWAFTILERFRVSLAGAIPLTRSRISFSQVIASLDFENTRFGVEGEPSKREVVASPSVGFRYDGRDSRLKPRHGRYFFTSLRASRVINGEGSTYYGLVKDARWFAPLTRRSVVALRSFLLYRFGKYPEYQRVGLGGAGTLRGYGSGEFQGVHVWVQTLEWRAYPFPKKLFRLPFAGLVDVTLGLVAFADAGIAWRGETDFRADRFHGGGGVGLRVYSPLQDVARFDFGLNASGGAHVYVTTGARF